MKRLGVLGCTGSVGEQTLAVAALHPERFQVVALAVRVRIEYNRSIHKQMLVYQFLKYQPNSR